MVIIGVWVFFCLGQEEKGSWLVCWVEGGGKGIGGGRGWGEVGGGWEGGGRRGVMSGSHASIIPGTGRAVFQNASEFRSISTAAGRNVPKCV